MKLLATADLHGDLGLYRSLVRTANEENPDAVLLCGDLLPKVLYTSFTTLVSIQEESVDRIDQILGEIKAPVYYIPGNDDWGRITFQNAANIDAQTVDVDGFALVGFPYVHTTPWSTNREATEQELGTKLLQIHQRLELADKRLIMVAHGPAYGILDLTLRGQSVGSKSILHFIEDRKPLVWFHGHIHEDFGHRKYNDTHIFNCACRHEIDLFRAALVEIKGDSVNSWDVVK